jgi:hypothetical protein
MDELFWVVIVAHPSGPKMTKILGVSGEQDAYFLFSDKGEAEEKLSELDSSIRRSFEVRPIIIRLATDQEADG